MHKHIKRVLLSSIALAALSTMSGCFSRQLLGFSVHPEKETMLMETYDTRDYLVWSKHEHVYWSCAESGDQLQCTRRCGGKTDLVCPTMSIFANSAGTNVR